ncbi:hypothetical protein [Intrasporangium sp. YIM S08009]|uniref:hypothetical protein n=1 Tax=Intrasporangium zincisolvens TaxID=3080018 RepID=UPI002B05AE71|nr:hypothetical protein [Intrasporangium sp. YIM S08009]
MSAKQSPSPSPSPLAAEQTDLRWPALVLPVVALALVGVLLLWAFPRSSADAAQPVTLSRTHEVVPRTARQQAFHDQMRKLWEDHVTWTRLAIVTFADGSAGFPAAAGRLLQNQSDIGAAIAPFYGDAAGARLTALLHDHITIAVEILEAAKAGDTAAFTSARTRWYANANDIADFLSAANPRFWPDAVLRDDMRVHLDQTLAEAAHELAGGYATGVADYDAVHAHILRMADMLSGGIIGAFPSAFR